MLTPSMYLLCILVKTNFKEKLRLDYHSTIKTVKLTK
jgi:hypothetical protein